ncbi:MAG: ACP S-malonyltransferase [Candidatus Margulisiibacteriota bacterium]
MKKVAIVFPGQGSQAVGMGADLVARFPEARALFDEASSVLSRDIATICFEGPESELVKTENAQVGLFLISAVLFGQLAKAGITPVYVAGHSLGELSAYYAAGVYSVSDAIRVIAKRGELMGQAYPSEQSAMAAVLGMDADTMAQVFADLQDPNVVMANFNCPGQIVISGQKASVERASEALRTAGAKRVIPLPVSGAFHSPLMAPAVPPFADFLKTVSFSDARVPVVLNRLAKPETAADALRENLALQIQSPVYWMQSVAYMAPQVDSFLECGAGKVLSGLIKKSAPDVPVLSVSSVETLESVLMEVAA